LANCYIISVSQTATDIIIMMHLVSLRFLTRVTERVLECVLLIAIPDHKSSPQVFRAAQSLVLCVSSCDQLFVFLSFTVGTEKYLYFLNLRLLITPIVSSKYSSRLYTNSLVYILYFCLHNVFSYYFR